MQSSAGRRTGDFEEEDYGLTGKRTEFDEDGLQTYPSTFGTGSEYTLAIFTALMAIVASIGSVTMIAKLYNKRKKSGIQLVIYLSILIGNVLMAVFTMPATTFMIWKYRIPLSKNSTSFNGTESKDVSALELTMCNINGFVYNVTRATTLWFVCLFTFDRLVFVCFPFRAAHMRKIHYWVASFLIWGYNIGISASPFMFGKLYQHLEYDGLICTWNLLDIMPAPLWNVDSSGNKTLSNPNIFTAYYSCIIIIPYMVPLFLIAVFSIIVAVELIRLHSKHLGSMSVKYDTGQDADADANRSPTYVVHMINYLENHRELKLSLIMLLTTIAYLICYSFWVYFFFLHFAILIGTVDKKIIYDPTNTKPPSTTAKVYKIHELVGFVHAVIQPPILYMILVGKKTKK